MRALTEAEQRIFEMVKDNTSIQQALSYPDRLVAMREVRAVLRRRPDVHDLPDDGITEAPEYALANHLVDYREQVKTS
ncbi:MAG: hypothetical protein Q8P13_01520 [bacterium]|nr:hypothetical protein [bacterium]